MEFRNIIDIFIDDDPGTVTLAVRGDILFAKCLCHGGGGWGRVRDEGEERRTTKIYIKFKE